MVNKYPHTATISWYSAGTVNTVGVWTPGTLNTIGIVCDIQPVNRQYMTGAGGAVLNYNWVVFADLFTGSDSVPAKANLTFFSADHIMKQIFNYQKHVEIQCQD